MSTSTSTNTNQAGNPDRDVRRLRRGVLWALGLGLLLVAVALAVPDLRPVLDRAADADGWWLALAVALEVASCLGYVATVRMVLARGPARDVRRLAWAEMAFGAVVPLGGAGGLAVGAWAMRAWGVPWSRVERRSAVIFLLTSAINALVLTLAGLGIWLGIGADGDGWLDGLLPAAAGAGAIACFAVMPWLARADLPGLRGRRARATIDHMATWVRDTERVAFRLDWRLLGALGYLLFDIAVLWTCLAAVGDSSVPVLALVAGYQIGYLSNLIPIPGAIGVLDGGLLGALVLYGVPAAPAAAAIVLYHAIALWIPTLGGTYGFARLRGSLGQAREAVGAPEVPAAVPAGGHALSASPPTATARA